MSAAPGTPAAAAPAQGSAVKTILIIGGVLVVLVVLALATTIIVGMKIARRTHVTQDGDKVRVETPLGTVEANQDSEQATKNLGVDVYPGARALKNNSASVSIGGMRTATAVFQTDDSPNKVADFYRKKFPNANYSENGSDHYSIVQTTRNGVVTISITTANNVTQLTIANVQKGVSSTQ